MSIIDIRNRARRDLHARAKVPAFYVSPFTSRFRRVYVRLHYKQALSGGLNSEKDWARSHEIDPRIIIMREDIAEPKNSFIFTFYDQVAFRIENVEPADGLTVTANVKRLKSKERENLPYPTVDLDPAEPPEEGGSGETPGEGVGKSFEFPILTPSEEFVVQHNLNKFPKVVLKGQDGEEFDARVLYVDRNKIIIRMTPANLGMVIVS